MSWQIETMIILVSAFGGILGLGFIAVRIQIAAQTKRMRLYKPLILELIYATPGIEESKLFAEIQKKCSYAIMPLAFYHVLDELRDDMIGAADQ